MNINFSGWLKKNFNGHTMRDEGGYILKGEYVLGGGIFLILQPTGKGGGQHAVWEFRIKGGCILQKLGRGPTGVMA